MADREYLNSGTLFQNKVKKNPKSPDYQGDMTLDLSALGIGNGKAKLRIAGWKKTSAKGTVFVFEHQRIQRARRRRRLLPRTCTPSAG